MSRKLLVLIPLLGTSFLAFTSSVSGMQVPLDRSSQSPETMLGRSASSVARIVAFGGNSLRVKLAIDSIQICSAGFQELTSKPQLEEALSGIDLRGVKPLPLPT